MGTVWRPSDNERMFRHFGVQCLYFQARIAPDKRFGQTELSSDAVHGFRYFPAVEYKLIRTSISQKLLHTDHGQKYQGGSKFTIPPLALKDGIYQSQPIYETIFKGDVIVVKNKNNRDYDILKKGYRDQLFAFDVKTILNVTSIDATGKEREQVYGVDYNLTINGVEPTYQEREAGTAIAYNELPFGVFVFGVNGESAIDIVVVGTQPITSTINVVWLGTENNPADGDYYTVEFICSPNYIVYDDVAQPRATEDNDLPKTVMTVRRSYFNPTKPATDTVVTNSPSVLDSDQIVYDDAP